MISIRIAAGSAFIEEAYQDTLSLMTELRDYLTETQTEEDRSAEARTISLAKSLRSRAI